MRSEMGDGEPTFIEKARRRQIVDAAVAVIARDGFSAASLARVAAEAGVSKGVVTYHFGGKEQLVRQVVTTVYEQGAEDVRGDVEAAGDHLAVIAAYIRGNAAFLGSDPRRVRVLVEIFTQFRDGDGRLVYDEASMGSVVEPLVILLRRGQEAGELAPLDAVVTARTIRAAIDAISPQLQTTPDLDVSAYAEQLVELFTRALRP